MRALSLLAVASGWLLTGCLSYLPDGDVRDHLRIDWRPDFATAQAEAKATGRPILLVGAAGELSGFC